MGGRCICPQAWRIFWNTRCSRIRTATPLQSSRRRGPTPTPLPALTAPVTSSPPRSSWTKASMCCWAWWGTPISPNRPSPRSRASSGRRSKCTMTAPTGGSSPACASAFTTATPSAVTSRAAARALRRSPPECSTTAARHSMPPAIWCWQQQAIPPWSRSWPPVRATACWTPAPKSGCSAFGPTSP